MSASRTIGVATVVALAGLAPAVAEAHSTGISLAEPQLTLGCQNCHTPPAGATPPDVTLQAVAGETDHYQVSMTPKNGRAFAGLNVSASNGTFTSLEADTRLLDGQITHTGRRSAPSGTTWKFGWKGCGGAQKLTAWVNNVDGNGNNAGDHSAKAELTVTTPACQGTNPPITTVTVANAKVTVERIASFASGTNPLGMTWAADGRMFIWAKEGTVHIVKNGQLLGTPFLDIRDKVNAGGDRGLLGLAIGSDNAVYLYYTNENNPGAPDQQAATTARVVRYQPSAGNPDVGNPSSATVLVGSVTTAPCAAQTDCIPADSNSHNGGALTFGPDGMLYLATGDGGDYHDPAGATPSGLPADWNRWPFRAQNLDLMAGKVLRFSPTDGSAPADNPFTGNVARARVWAYGFRNPFRMSFHKTKNELYVGNVGWESRPSVGWESREEVNKIEKGGNYGWPCVEGDKTVYWYGARFECTSVTPAQTKFPFYSYPIGAEGKCIIGGPALAAPAPFSDVVWIGDYDGSTVSWLGVKGDGTIEKHQLASNADKPVALAIGPDGYLYYAALAAREVRRFVSTNGVPTISGLAATPASPTVGTSVQLAATVSDDGLPLPPGVVTKSWTAVSGPGTPTFTSTSAVPTTVQFPVPGTYLIRLGASDGGGVASTATADLTVIVGCPSPQSPCGATCVNLSSDAANCGSCNMSCASGFACQLGGCLESCATAAAKRCTGNVPQTCTGGVWTGTSPCGSGLTCQSGTCVACTSGAKQCSGNTPQTCNASGVWVSGAACGTGLTCTSGNCLCTSGAKQCSGNTPQTCNASGVWVSGAACGTGLTCTSGNCLCTSGAKQCSGSTPQTCNASGVWVSGAACGAGLTCQSGDCLCTSGAKQCSGNTPQTCNASGAWVSGAACGAGLTCQSGNCLCTSGAKQCSGNTPQTCNASGAWVSGAACGAGLTCQSGNCLCTSGAKQCSGNTPQTCNASGAWVSGAACGAGLTCQGGNCLCTPGAKQCSGNVSQLCDAGGQWTSNMSCAVACDAATGNCVTTKAQGAACGAGGECASGNCVDGVCCNGPCNQACKTCAGTGACRAVVNADDPDSCTAGSLCDGAGACTSRFTAFNYPSVDVSRAIVRRPDGSLVFAERGGGKLGIVQFATPSSPTVTEVTPSPPNPSGIGWRRAIAVGTDGSVWYTDSGSVGRMTTAGVFTYFALGAAGDPVGIAVRGSNEVWITASPDNIVRLDATSGAMAVFRTLTVGSDPRGITVGPDGNLWFVENQAEAVGRITPAGAMVEYKLPAPAFMEPNCIAAGPDGRLWFGAGGIGAITTSGQITLYGARDLVAGFAVGPDGNLWYAGYNGTLGRLTTSGVETDFFFSGSNPASLAVGADNNLWFADDGHNWVVRFKVP